MDTALDWSLVASFLAVADGGSLSAAARASGMAQPTLGRRVRALEGQLGVTLFDRVAQGLVPTEAAAALLPAARAMRAAAAGLGLAAAAQRPGLAGTVRITASVVVAHTALPPMLAALRAAEPDIAIELAPSDASDNLLFHEADIALRMYRPRDLDVVTRHVADLSIGLYGARDYLERVGRPEDLADLARFDVVGLDRSDLDLRTLAGLGLDVTRDRFGVRCDDPMAYWALVRAGCGIGGVQCRVADADPAVERVLPHLDLPAWPIWLTATAALYRAPRIRRVWDALAEGFARLDAPRTAG